MNYLKFTLLLLTFIFLQVNINPTIRYVKAGNPTPLSPYTSWATASDSIQKCIDISSSGDTIYVGNGVYKERVVLKSSQRFIGSGIDSCIIDTREVQIVNLNDRSVTAGDSCYISGFCIYTSTQRTGIGIFFWRILTLPLEGSIENNKIVSAVGGIYLHNTNVIARNNIIINCKYGVSYDIGQPKMYDNFLLDIEGEGLNAGGGGRATMVRNLIVSHENSQYFSGFNCSFTVQNLLTNNTIIALKQGSSGVDTFSDTVINNTIVGLFDHSIKIEGGGVFVNNAISGGKTAFDFFDHYPYIIGYNNIWDVWKVSNRDTIDSTKNIYRDPMFVNSDSGDYHLQMYSPLINAGDPDILDPDGSRSDIGAYGGPQGTSYPYSDLPPRVPRGLQVVAAGHHVTITWIENTESDFHHYTVYMDSVAGFTPGDWNKIDTLSLFTFKKLTVPSYVKQIYFKLTATDNQGNTSAPSEEAYINLTGIQEGETTRQEYNLFHNYPDPFSLQTTIGYTLKEAGYVKLNVYDIRGAHIGTLVNEVQGTGYHEVNFNPSQHTENQNPLASGIFIYRIDVIGKNNIPVYSMTNKMIHLK